MKNPSPFITLCRADVADPAAQWFHTVPPPGEYPGGTVTHNGRQIKDAVVVIDRAAYDSIVEAFRADAQRPDWPGLLVDREHFSLDSGKPSDALAWARDIRVADDGVWTRWEFTAPGREAWDGKVLVSRSPVMRLESLGGNRFRPVRLDSIAMTNAPHFDTLSTLAAARAAEAQPGGDAHNPGAHMKKVLALLGLDETATEDEAVAKVQALIDAGAAATAEMKKAQAACRKHACDAFIAAHRASIQDEAAFRAAYDKDPETATAVFGAFRQVAPAAARIAAREAGTPGDQPTLLARYEAMPEGKDKRAFLRAHAAEINAARTAAG